MVLRVAIASVLCRLQLALPFLWLAMLDHCSSMLATVAFQHLLTAVLDCPGQFWPGYSAGLVTPGPLLATAGHF
jgi:hypothetical protein